MATLHGRAFLDWLKAAGLVPERTRRVVIEASVDSVVLIHAELHGQAEMIMVNPVTVLGTNVKVIGD